MKTNIYPCLWFDGNAKEAVDYYCDIFSDSVITDENPVVVRFTSSGQTFMCLNGGPHFTINPSISIFVIYEDPEKLENNWNKLMDGGSAMMPLDSYDWSKKYGWVQDKFGVSWQLFLGKHEDVGQKFTPCMMFTGKQHGKAKEAIDHYTAVFDNSKVTGILNYSAEDNEPTDTIKHAQFSLDGNVFMVMDSSHDHGFGFNEAISMVVECDTQREIDYYWEKLSAVPEAEQCGWLKDKFGVSWQIFPSVLKSLMKDPQKSPKVTEAFMKMKKLEIGKLINV